MDDDGRNHPIPSPLHGGDDEEMTLSHSQVSTLITLERTGAALSIVGITLILVTYWAYKRLRTVPNLFILFASIANAGASAACLMGYDGIRNGVDSALCQAQAFLLQMLMQSDPWWSFAMAVNVFLVFFLGANPASFRKYLWLYCIVCFGAPFVPALVLLLIRSDRGEAVYGDATLWCWIGSNWNALRIYTYYMPIWILILLSTVIYFAVGYHVFHQRNQLRNLTFSQLTSNDKDKSQSDERDSAEKNLTDGPEYYGTAVTEVQITTDSSPITQQQQPGHRTKLPAKPPRIMSSMETLGGPRRWAAPPAEDADDHPAEGVETMCPPRLDTAARFETTCSSAPQPAESRRSKKTHSTAWQRFVHKLKKLDPIKLAYLRTSFIFAISVLVTWTPSSINRVHTLVHPGEPNFALNAASAVVLPLQGVWNAVIYFITSWPVFRAEVSKTILSLQAKHSWIQLSTSNRRRYNQPIPPQGAVRVPTTSWIAHGPSAAAKHGDNSVAIELDPRRMGAIRTLRGSF